VAGELIPGHGGASGLWLATGCALFGLPLALALGLARSNADIGRPTRESAP
jgi:hypothetical protein